MRYYFIAGEPSGDLHAANCMRELRKIDPDASFAFTGGERMTEQAGVAPDIHIRDMAFMGFVDVLLNLKQINKNFARVKEGIAAFKPHLLVLVDYPGFNLRMARWATERGIKVDYYISPTVWAWKANRVEKIRAFTNRLLVILPFEKDFYALRNHEVFFVGHPLIDAVEEQRKNIGTREDFVKRNKLSGRDIIAVLPGSRKQELERMLSLMVGIADSFSSCEFVVAGSGNLPESMYREAEKAGVRVVFNQTYELLTHARAGVIKSGTSTLESALFDLPQVVCYRSGSLSFAIAKRIVNVKYISLVNLVLDRPAVKELIQTDLTRENLIAELSRLISNEEYRQQIRNAYAELKTRLGGAGASRKVADFLYQDAQLN